MGPATGEETTSLLKKKKKKETFELGKPLERPILKGYSRQKEHCIGAHRAQQDRESLRKFRRLL